MVWGAIAEKVFDEAGAECDGGDECESDRGDGRAAFGVYQLFLDTVTTSDEQIDLSDLPQSEDGDVDYVRVYMTKAGETGKYFVAQVAKGTTSYSITTNDTDLAANSVYGVCESDVEYKWRDVIDDFAIGQWFVDNEQFQKAGLRIGAAKQKMADWGYELEAEQGGSGLFDYERW